jgi:hypothetical protein
MRSLRVQRDVRESRQRRQSGSCQRAPVNTMVQWIDRCSGALIEWRLDESRDSSGQSRSC